MMPDNTNEKSNMLSETTDKIVKCATCQRVLKSPREMVEGRQTILCDACYKDLMFLHPTNLRNINHDVATLRNLLVVAFFSYSVVTSLHERFIGC